MQEKVRWWLVGFLLVLGGLAIYWALRLADFGVSTWVSILVEVGATLALVGILYVLERQLVGSVHEVRLESVAARKEAAQARVETEALRERIVKLEDLDAAHREEMMRISEADEAVVKRVEVDVDREAVCDLLVKAWEDRLFASDYHARTGRNPDCSVLYMEVEGEEEDQSLALDFESFTHYEGEWGENFGIEPTDSLVTWTDESVATISVELERALKRRNDPPDDFSFGYAIRQVMDAYEVMRRARAAKSGDPHRLKGLLKVLINEEWCFTSYGLEAIERPVAFKRSEGLHSNGGSVPTWRFDSITITEVLPDMDAGTFDKAVTWLREREDLPVYIEPSSS